MLNTFTYSFIIPHHNCPDFLTRLLETIPHRRDVEIIVVDDNSDEDKLPTITRSDVQLIKIPASESKGAGHARNVGLDHATGKWLLFADSDDYYDTSLMSCLDMHKNRDIDILYFSAYTNVRAEQPVQMELNSIDKNIQLYIKSPRKSRDVHRLGLSSNVPWNKMFNHEFIKGINARFEEIPLSNDAWFVNFAGSKARNISAITDKLYYYVINDSGVTKRKRPKEHYYLAMKSNKKRNLLKYQLGLMELVALPGFNKYNVLRDFGKLTYCEFCLYKLVTDKVIRKCFLRSVFCKLFH